MRALRRDDLLHRADGDPRLHEVGRRVRRTSTTCPSCACSARSASRSTRRRGSGTTRSIGGGRCPIVDTWWQTETGAIMITHAARAPRRPSPASAGTPLPGIEAAVVDEEGERGRARRRRACSSLRRPWPAMLRTLYRDDDRYVETYFSKFGTDDLPRRRRRAQRRRRLLLGHRARRRRDQRLRPPPVDRGGRVGDRLAPEGRRGGGDRPERRGHRPVDRARS